MSEVLSQLFAIATITEVQALAGLLLVLLMIAGLFFIRVKMSPPRGFDYDNSRIDGYNKIDKAGRDNTRQAEDDFRRSSPLRG